jgi:hypothetical protein
MRSAILVGLLLSVLFSTPARCDSDGCFCSSANLLAYELSLAEKMAGHHVLYVVFLGGKEGISKPKTLALPRFQVHGMKCSQDKVELIGWDRRYVVAVSRSKLALIKEEPSPHPGSTLGAGYVSDNLGMVSAVTRGAMPRAQVIPLPANDPDSTYALRITGERQSLCKLRVTITIIQNRRHRRAKTLTIFDDQVSIECGE